MYYHFAILSLFRPLIKLRIIGSSITPRDVCSQAADAITGLLRSYAQLYTLRRTPSFVPYFVLTSSIMHLAIAATGSTSRSAARAARDAAKAGQSLTHPAKLDPHVTDALARGIADLTEMAPCHHFAQQALNILRFLAKKWNIDVEIKTTEGDGEPRVVVLPDPERATRPVTTGLNFFAPNFLESDFSCSWGGGDGGHGDGNGGGGTGSETRADKESRDGPKIHPEADMVDPLENPLFWPFPSQGRPMLPIGRELEEAGFEFI
jgi:hypothetical protein